MTVAERKPTTRPRFVVIASRRRPRCEVLWFTSKRVQPTPTACQRCWCGAPVYNSHHCTAGHVQTRRQAAAAPALIAIDASDIMRGFWDGYGL